MRRQNKNKGPKILLATVVASGVYLLCRVIQEVVKELREERPWEKDWGSEDDTFWKQQGVL